MSDFMCFIFHGLCINTHEYSNIEWSHKVRFFRINAAFVQSSVILLQQHSFNGLYRNSEWNKRKGILYALYVFQKWNVIFLHIFYFLYVRRIVFSYMVWFNILLSSSPVLNREFFGFYAYTPLFCCCDPLLVCVWFVCFTRVPTSYFSGTMSMLALVKLQTSVVVAALFQWGKIKRCTYWQKDRLILASAAHYIFHFWILTS